MISQTEFASCSVLPLAKKRTGGALKQTDGVMTEGIIVVDAELICQSSVILAAPP